MAKRKSNGPPNLPTQNADATTTTTTPSQASNELIKRLNALPIPDFQTQYIKPSHLTHPPGIDFKAAADLSKHDLDACLALVDSTSRRDYEGSSFGWDARRKRREMRQPEMRYLLVRDDDDGGGIQGFLSFMLTHDSLPVEAVLYVYEIHLAESLRKVGLGAHLMGVVEEVAAGVGVGKVMLTCFLGNQRALGFYRGRGYGRDGCSPEDRLMRRKVVKVDYVILSKVVGGGLET